MTRRDYVKLAEALRNAWRYSEGMRADVRAGVHLTITAIAEGLSSDNPRFDSDLFWRSIRNPE